MPTALWCRAFPNIPCPSFLQFHAVPSGPITAKASLPCPIPHLYSTSRHPPPTQKSPPAPFMPWCSSKPAPILRHSQLSLGPLRHLFLSNPGNSQGTIQHQHRDPLSGAATDTWTSACPMPQVSKNQTQQRGRGEMCRVLDPQCST